MDMDQVIQVVSRLWGSFSELTEGLNAFILLPIFVAVSTLLLSYFRNYHWPAKRLCENLTHVVAQIREARFRPRGFSESLESELDGIFAMSPFRTLWSEYCSSLHVVYGRHESKTILATAPAETFFSKESMVDLNINADFYRHLPGILTGIGIIGTFSGLVWGLHEFKPAGNDALSSLPLLLKEVTSAFIGSGFAILAAILVTFKEKSILTRCYRAVEDLCREIDGLYATGAGEEYLARLVMASEGHARVQEKQSQALPVQVGGAIREALSQPMSELALVVQRVTENQERAIGSILDEVLKTFATRLEETFGAQIEKVNQSFEKASASMDQVQQSMTLLLGDMASVSTQAVDQMSGTLAAAIENSSLAQDRMNDQMRGFLDEIHTTLLRNIDTSAEAQDLALRAALSKMQLGLSQLATDRAQLVETQERRHQELTGAIERLVQSMDAAAVKTSENVGALQATASGAISGMNSGAVVMRMAADRFSMAGNTLSGAMEKSEALADALKKMEALIAANAQSRRFG